MKIDDNTFIGNTSYNYVYVRCLDEPFRSQLLLFPEMREALKRMLDTHGTKGLSFQTGVRLCKCFSCISARALLAKLPPETP